MDLNQFDTVVGAQRGARMHVEGPNGRKLYRDEKNREGAVILRLLGVDSHEHRATMHQQMNVRLKDAAGRGRKTRLDAEALEDEQLELLAACTVGWENVVVEGEDVAFSPEAAVRLYRRFPWLREQAWDFLQDRANFLGE